MFLEECKGIEKENKVVSTDEFSSDGSNESDEKKIKHRDGVVLFFFKKR